MPRFALVSDFRSADHDDDLAPLLDALGSEAELALWDDPEVEWSAYDLAVIRSTWNYVERPDEFLGWAAETQAKTRLVNPLDVIRWNIDKHYLADLHRSGLAVVPTVFVEPGAGEYLLPAGRDLVVKPAISAGARDTARYGHDDAQAAADHVERLISAGRPALIQPYLERVDQRGETAVAYLGGKFSHALRKGALLNGTAEMVEGLFAREEIAATEITEPERELADATMDVLQQRFGPLLYARIDLLPHDDGRPVLLEVELIEPSLFHSVAPNSAEAFADAIRAL